MPKFELRILADTVEELSLYLGGHRAPAYTPVLAAAAVDDEGGPVNANAPSVDKNGLPWDARIHSGNKAVTADGSWRRRRGVDDATIAAVEQQLRAGGTVAAAAAPVITPVAASLPIPAAALAPPPAAALAPPPAAALAPPPAAAPAPVVATAPTDDPAKTYVGFMNAVAVGMQAGKIDSAYIAQLAQRLQLPTAITDLMQRPELIPTAYATLQNEGKLA